MTDAGAGSSLLSDLKTTQPPAKIEKVGQQPIAEVEDPSLRPIDMNTYRPVIKIAPEDVVIVQNADNGKFDIMSRNVYESRIATPTEKNIYRDPTGQLVEILSTDKGHIVLNAKQNYQLNETDEKYFDQRFTKV